MPDRVQNSLLLRELFHRLDHTWEELRLTTSRNSIKIPPKTSPQTSCSRRRSHNMGS
jgi:hypothetical protein